MYGPGIIARTLTETRLQGKKYPHLWQYNSRSDHHSKVACWAILFDLLRASRLLQEHVRSGSIGFGINHPMKDFRANREKNLDLVLCAPMDVSRGQRTFKSLQSDYRIILEGAERDELDRLPDITEMKVGAVYLALEAKACMTAHGKAKPRLFDELNSSHLSIHGSTSLAIAAGLVMVNRAETFVSPDMNKFMPGERPLVVNAHDQPRDTASVIDKVKQLPRRSNTGEEGYDALAIVVVDCRNDFSPVTVVSEAPAPRSDDIFDYDAMIARIAHLYESRFPHE